MFGGLPDAGGVQGGEKVYFGGKKGMLLGCWTAQAPIEMADHLKNAATASDGVGMILRGFAGKVVVVVVGAMGGKLLAVVHFQKGNERYAGRFRAVLLIVIQEVVQLAQFLFESRRNQHGKGVGGKQ